MIRHDCEYKIDPEHGYCDECAELAEARLLGMREMYWAIKDIISSYTTQDTRICLFILADMAQIVPGSRPKDEKE